MLFPLTGHFNKNACTPNVDTRVDFHSRCIPIPWQNEKKRKEKILSHPILEELLSSSSVLVFLFYFYTENWSFGIMITVLPTPVCFFPDPSWNLMSHDEKWNYLPSHRNSTGILWPTEPPQKMSASTPAQSCMRFIYSTDHCRIAGARCIKSCRYRSRASVNVHVKP